MIFKLNNNIIIPQCLYSAYYCQMRLYALFEEKEKENVKKDAGNCNDNSVKVLFE